MHKTFGLILTVLMAVIAFNSAVFFMLLGKVSFVEWLLFFPGNLAIVTFCVGYLLHSRIVLAFSLPMFIYFGIFGLLAIGWSKLLIPLQVGNIIMLFAALWIIYGIFNEKTFKEATIGLLCAAIVGNIFVIMQQHYVYQNHWHRMQEVLQFQPPERKLPED